METEPDLEPRIRRSKLAWLRRERKLTQKQMSELTGIPLATYWRLETEQMKRPPPLTYLVNCALVLDVSLEEVAEPEWLQWTAFDAKTPKPASTHVRLSKS